MPWRDAGQTLSTSIYSSLGETRPQRQKCAPGPKAETTEADDGAAPAGAGGARLRGTTSGSQGSKATCTSDGAGHCSPIPWIPHDRVLLDNKVVSSTREENSWLHRRENHREMRVRKEGVQSRMPRTPAVFERKKKWKLESQADPEVHLWKPATVGAVNANHKACPAPSRCGGEAASGFRGEEASHLHVGG